MDLLSAYKQKTSLTNESLAYTTEHKTRAVTLFSGVLKIIYQRVFMLTFHN